MKFNNGSQSVISTGEINRANMEVNAKSFSVLAGLYSDTIKAVVREYSTNALDEHIKTGNPDPFHVHLPTTSEPYFYVRDFGDGLDQDEFLDVYLTFFKSGKDHSNEFNGCLGLGSKVLFAEAIGGGTIETWKNGVHCVYDCFIGREGTPDYTLLSRNESDEPNGVKVTIQVKSHNFHSYEKAAFSVFKWFERKPKFIGKTIEVPTLDQSAVKAGYRIDKVYGNKSYAVMGNVAYELKYHESLKKYQDILEDNYHNYILFFDIGEISFSPNREGLLYNNDKTIKAIERKLEKIKQDVANKINQEISTCKTEWDAVLKFCEINKNYPDSLIPKKLIFNGKPLNHIKNYVDYSNTTEYPIEFGRYKKRGVDTSRMYLNDGFSYVINDLKIGSLARCKELNEKTNKTVYLLTDSLIKQIPITYDKNKFIKASSLPKPTPKARAKGNVGKVTKLVDGYSVTNCWKLADASTVKDKYYIIRDRYNVKYLDKIITPMEMNGYLKAADLFGKIEVYAVNHKEEQEYIDAGWEKIDDILDKKTKSVQKQIENQKDFLNKMYTIMISFYEKSYYGGYNREKDFHFNINSILSRKENCALINACIDEKIFFNKNKNKYDSLIETIDKLKNQGIIIKTEECKKTKAIFEAAIDKYPALNENIDKDHLHYYLLGVSYASGDN